MLKALILLTAILGIWLAVGSVRTPGAPVAATGYTATAGTVLEPGTRGPVIQL